jgi:hypothetical protein
MRQRIDADGELIEAADGQLRAHPLFPAEASNRGFITRTLRAPGLAVEPLMMRRVRPHSQ